MTTLDLEPAHSTPPAAQEDELSRWCESSGTTFLTDLRHLTPSALFTERIPIAYARENQLMGFVEEGASDRRDSRILLVTGNPRNFDAIDVTGRTLGQEITLAAAQPSAVIESINHAYQQRTGQADALIQSMDRGAVLDELKGIATHEDLLDVDTRAPVIKLVNLLLFDAVKQGASDVHVQPYEGRTVVRMRIDGVLFNSFELPNALQEEVVSRIKVMGRMNIAEKRLPQDGRATVQVGDRLVDLRIASLPTSHGERAVIRLLDKGARLYSLNELGMPDGVLQQYRSLIGIEHGLILVTGPTGSGKTTSLYAALQQINTTERNTLTLEDPIEYQLDGISQTQISTRKGMTFASGLRNVLRQDPDIIMVGEIRDHETAVMAIQSALTGHLVFSTLHTNDAASAVTRLLDLGIEPYLVSSSLVGVLAQRLVRRVCKQCRTVLGHDQRERLRHEMELSGCSGRSIENTRVGTGCESCRGTGFRGRCGIFELLTVDDAVRDGIQSRATAAQIKRLATGSGMQTLRQDALAKTLEGLTTLDEVERVTMRLGS